MHGPAEADSLCAVVSALQTHCSAAPPATAHLLRRRAASLLGHSLSAPELVKPAAHEQTGEGRGHEPSACMRPPQVRTSAHEHASIDGWYTLLGMLLQDPHRGVSLTAAIAIRRLIEASDARSIV